MKNEPNTTQKSSFDEMISILEEILFRKAHTYSELIRRGYNAQHLEYLSKHWMLPSVGGRITGECYIKDGIKGFYTIRK